MTTVDEHRESVSIRVPRAVRWIVATLEDAGYETWTVGGAVRDAVMGQPSGDWDLATRAEPAEVRRIFKRTVPVGVEHGTVGVLARDGTMYEVTTFRRDVETFGRHAVVAFAESLEEDLERRDFTINALAWHPLRERLLDPHQGASDIRDRILRTVGDPVARFAEDYLRVLRALRFAGRYQLRIESDTWQALTEASGHLGVLSPERIREELWKVLSGDPHPATALELYRTSGALGVVAPELARVPEWSAEAWRETLAAVEAIPASRTELRLVALLGAVGGPPAGAEDPERSLDPGPAATPERERGMGRAAALLTRHRHSNARTAAVSALVGAGPELPGPDASDAALRRWLARVGRERVSAVLRWAIARCRGVHGDGRDLLVVARRLRSQLHAGHPLTVGELALSGRDLIRMGLKPGPHFGRILDGLLERVLDDPSANDPHRLETWAREHAEGRG